MSMSMYFGLTHSSIYNLYHGGVCQLQDGRALGVHHKLAHASGQLRENGVLVLLRAVAQHL